MAKKTQVVKKIEVSKMNPLVRTVLVAIVAFLLGTLTWSWGNISKNKTEENEVQNLVTFVNDAAVLVENKQDAAFADFKVEDGSWWKGDKYIFVYDMNANTLVLPPSPEIEGTNRWTTQDTNGVYYVREMVQQLQNKNYTWVMYSYPKPGEKNASPKVAYVKKVTMGNKTVLVGSGIYY